MGEFEGLNQPLLLQLAQRARPSLSRRCSQRTCASAMAAAVPITRVSLADAAKLPECYDTLLQQAIEQFEWQRRPAVRRLMRSPMNGAGVVAT